MRLVQIALPADHVAAIRNELEREGIDYVAIETDSEDRFAVEITFPLPTHAVETVLDDLDEAGLTDDAQTVILDAETVMSEKFEVLKESFDQIEKTEDQISRQELSTRAVELTPTMPVYLVMTLISAIVATAGLLLDSPAVVVGSMVIAPLIGPALSASVGTVTNNPDLFRSGFASQIIGVVVAILGAAIFAYLSRVSLLVPPGTDVFAISEVSERLEPDLLSLFIALGAGVAGILSLVTGISAALVGVMIAAALIPPAAAAGVALAWGEPVVAIGAGVLVFVNLISINIAGLVTLWYAGYQPNQWWETSVARREMIKQIGIYGVAVAAMSSFLLASSLTAVRQARFETAVHEAVEAVVSRDEYDEMVPIEYGFEYSTSPVFSEPTEVMVQLGSESGEPVPTVSEAIADEIEERTGNDVLVRIQFTALTSTEEA